MAKGEPTAQETTELLLGRAEAGTGTGMGPPTPTSRTGRAGAGARARAMRESSLCALEAAERIRERQRAAAQLAQQQQHHHRQVVLAQQQDRQQYQHQQAQAGAGAGAGAGEGGRPRSGSFRGSDARSPRMASTYGAVVDFDLRMVGGGAGPEGRAAAGAKEAGGGGGGGEGAVEAVLSQVPAVIIASVLNFMVGIPFGASYFPVHWSSSGEGGAGGGDDDAPDDVQGTFPLGGKETLGLRMFLFSTAVAQLVYTYKSNFDNGIGLQMVENIPFCLTLARIVIGESGYGMDALSTLFFIFGFSSFVVGLVFYLLGRYNLGRVVYFFPSHVLVGCIGGIGAFLAVTSVEVTTNSRFSLDAEGFQTCLVEKFPLVGTVLLFELVLRLLMAYTRDEKGRVRYPLLGPCYYCAITPVFYLGLALLGVSRSAAAEAGFFFPPLQSGEGGGDAGGGYLSSVFNDSLLDIFHVVDLSTICWPAVLKSVPTMISLTAFSLIHVPINIPAFAISTDVEPDMDKELMAHGWSNAIAGVFGGLQNYLCYSNSVVYAKSGGGRGRASSLCIVMVTVLCFIFGPTAASYVPRCMAGTLLLHIGIDLVLEGVYDSYGKYDLLEYSGIWLIAVVMVVLGMDAALVAGAIAALSTYAVQSIAHQYPIKNYMSAASLRSSAWHRSPDARAILDEKDNGRNRIFLVQLQGHIFFGNAATMTGDIKKHIAERQGTEEEPKVVILDFTPVLGLDSSAAQAIARLKDTLHNQFNIPFAVFVTGSTEGFPCAFNLSKALSDSGLADTALAFATESTPVVDDASTDTEDDTFVGSLLEKPLPSFYSSDGMLTMNTSLRNAVFGGARNLGNGTEGESKNRVCETLDEALVFAEDVLIALEDPIVLQEDMNEIMRPTAFHRSSATSSFRDEEKEFALRYLGNLCPSASEAEIEKLLSFFTKEKYKNGDVLWTQGSHSDCAKLILVGEVLSTLEADTGFEEMDAGAIIGELGLVQGTERLSTVEVISDHATMFSLSRPGLDTMARDSPGLANHIYMMCIQNLAHRVQHVSNRILEKRSLPV